MMMANARSLLNRVGTKHAQFRGPTTFTSLRGVLAEIKGTSAMLATNKRPAQLSAANWEIML